MNLLINRKIGLVLLLLLIFGHIISQNQQIVFDIKKTSANKFNSPKEISESFLKYFLSPDSTDYSVFYSANIFCLLIEEEIKNKVTTQKISSSEDLCKDSIINEIFESTVRLKRQNFTRHEDFFKFIEIEVEKSVAHEKKNTLKSQYKFDLFDLSLYFKNKMTNKSYVLNIFDVYNINYKWYILDPSFEILPE